MTGPDPGTAPAAPAGDSGLLAVTERTRLRRQSYLQVTERAALDAILDAGLVAHVTACDDGLPAMVPMGYARDGDRLLLHGSTGAGLLRLAAAGAPLAVAVTLLDGLSYARSLFDSSMRYRSAVVFGTARPVPNDEKLPALRVLSERLMPGRWAEVRPPTTRELAGTLVLALPLTEVSVKISAGPPGDDEPTTVDPACWAGVLPLRLVTGEPQPAPDVLPGTPLPESLSAAARRVADSAAGQ